MKLFLSEYSVVVPHSESQQAPLAKTALLIRYFEECQFLKTYTKNLYCTRNFILYARKLYNVKYNNMFYIKYIYVSENDTSEEHSSDSSIVVYCQAAPKLRPLPFNLTF